MACTVFLSVVRLWLCFFFFLLWFSRSHGHTTYPRRRSSSASWWRPTSSQTWPTVSEFTTHPQSPSAFPKGLQNRKLGNGSTQGVRTLRIQVACTLPGFFFFFYQKEIISNFKKRYRRVSVERCTHVPSEPKTPADWSGGGEGAPGRTGSARFLETVAEKLRRPPTASTFTTSNPWVSHDLKAEVTCWHADVRGLAWLTG